MENLVLEKYKIHITVALIAVFSIIALYLRLIPMIIGSSGDILDFVAMDDPMYQLRQAENLVANFPKYSWFDPMTYIPYGSLPHWGVMFTYIIATIAIVTGATSRDDIIRIALLVSPILSALLVPVVYILVKKISDRITGIFAALFMAFVGGQYFARGVYGYADHHVAEVFFGAIFILMYIITLQKTRELKIESIFKNIREFRIPILFGILTGVSYTIMFLNMPTAVLFAFIVILFTIIQSIIDFLSNKKTDYIVITNTLTFSTATVLFYILGLRIVETFRLAHYSDAHVIIYISIILISAAVYLIFKDYRTIIKKSKDYIKYAPFVIGVIAAATYIMKTYISYMIGSFFEFFGKSSVAATVQEARGWILTDAWNAYNFSLILFGIGFGILAYMICKNRKAEHMLILIWSIIILIATTQHIRYEYYLSVNIAIISAIAVGYIFNGTIRDTIKSIKTFENKLSTAEPSTKKENAIPPRKIKKQPNARSAKQETILPSYIKPLLLTTFLIISALFIVTSFEYEYKSAHVPRQITPDWKTTLVWFGENTPETGIDYYGYYDQKTFEYPQTAYGVMSWWDYGHMITYISNRIPNSNPFQQGVAGEYSASAYFMAESEDTANKILDTLNTKYVITDIEMVLPKFWAMATWHNPQLGMGPYITTVIMPRQSMLQREPQSGVAYTEKYYKTMVSRLHLYDGTAYRNDNAIYIEYTTGSSPLQVTYLNRTTYEDAQTKIHDMPQVKGTSKNIISPDPLFPIGEVNALKHYRLIYESPTTTLSSNYTTVKYVKVFEYVPGATVFADGYIETNVITNTGRTFRYIQMSENGTFVLPYVGEYTLNNAFKIYVSESDVQNGEQLKI
jgi:dolichyl-diphosphooligosaccharide--protein glycosyltransferase